MMVYRCFRDKWICFGLFVSLILSAAADEIILGSGDVIHGKITEQTDAHLVIVHPDLGTFQIPRERIRSFLTGPSAEEKPAPTAEEEIPDRTDYMPDFSNLNDWAAAQKKKGWSASANLSLNGSYGNTDEQSGRFGAAIKRKKEDTQTTYDLAYYNKISDGTTTDNKLTTGLLVDWLKPDSRWFYFASTRYDYDQFESWRHRAAAHGGPGYHLIESPRLTMNLRTGPGARKEWGSDNDDVRFEGAAALDLEWKISKRQTLSAMTGFYPVLTDFDDYRTRSTLDWRFLMDRELNLSLLLGLEHEYLNIVDPGSKQNDTRVYMGIQYDF